jgi:hypothetical protein
MVDIYIYINMYISVGIATGWKALVQFPAGQDFYLLLSVQADSGAHPASYSMRTKGSFPRGKATGA